MTQIDKNIDLIRKLKADKKELEKTLAKLEQQVFDRMNQLGIDTLTTPTGGKAEIKEREKYNVTDWTRFYDYLIENEATDLLQKRVSDASVKERLNYSDDIREFIEVETVKSLQIK